MYVITGASGNTGKGIVERLLAAGKPVRAIARTAEKMESLKALGAQVVTGDLMDSKFLIKSLTGATAVYAMIPPDLKATNMRSYQNQVGDAMVMAVNTTGVKYVVTLSSVGAHLPDGAGVVQGLHDFEKKWEKVEGVNVLHLRPTYFMENLMGSMGLIKRMGAHGMPIKADLKFPLVAAKDIAVLAADRLMKLDFTGRSIQYVLGPRDVTPQEITQVLGRAIGKPDLSHVQVSYEDARKGFLSFGVSESVADGYIEFLTSVNEGRVMEPGIRNSGNTTPTTLEEFAESFAAVYLQN
jgi:uncharacterized protein YbjT (DUF2867 family)